MMNKVIMLFAIPGGWEWVLILVAVLILFGAKKIPQVMKGLGQGINEFKKAKSGEEDKSSNP